MNTQRVIEQLKRHEGLRLYVYDDATGREIRKGSRVQGHPTIGVGRLLTSARGLSTIEIEMLLENDIEVVVDELNRNVPWWNELNESRQAVMVNLCFNLGWPRLSLFENMLDAAEKGNWDRAADELMDSKWFRQVGLRGLELVEQLRTGTWQD
jgi:lysozyme